MSAELVPFPQNDPSSASTTAGTELPTSKSQKVDISMRPIVAGVPKGMNVSGRSWKVRPQKKASNLLSKKNKTYTKRMEEKRIRQLAIEKENDMKERRRQEILEKKERRLEQERRHAENEYKNAAQSAQSLNKNVGLKMRSLSKKQLRQIKKTRMNVKTGVVEFVPAYAK
mmetsp:Transcript_43098/g.101089  ORF Transcript_43098/g.101089 Transcript_43098/m.101089 type:complete len:170 (-) Transcript_43098:140-649(-)|eukprot:CAMPEP_0113308888 /NCGR_PEP_ID=MMETSP0010_2-20120614/7160_1 /TAXON_ID=216773 ORGANISM="Corethron hystrix, Strain 308" /NCGR_SAMPLE_ID=MMETSP0010_2 /ASSEMBLY_ACC=CAM_ASM_000155 /LENGTH=169 /DNA_ID=CAMNT_0000164047 /DNA_START=161 /DNA_END=670 /DNA_ORIENTATION=+ /assembly_acc=CAM_ASM_000155